MEKIFYAGDEFRENELSKQPGGVTVIVEYTNGKVIAYDKIKNAQAYIRTTKRNSDVKNAYVKD